MTSRLSVFLFMMKLRYKIKYKSPNSWQNFSHIVLRFNARAWSSPPKWYKTFGSFSPTETEQSIETTRAALGDEAYIVESGKQMNLDGAVAYAVKELQFCSLHNQIR
jgi:hypothetical protein